MYSFLELAKRLKENLGLRIFSLLYFNDKIIGDSTNLNKFCKIAELMVDLTDSVMLENIMIK